jgi:hypothetical protein
MLDRITRKSIHWINHWPYFKLWKQFVQWLSLSRNHLTRMTYPMIPFPLCSNGTSLQAGLKDIVLSRIIIGVKSSLNCRISSSTERLEIIGDERRINQWLLLSRIELEKRTANKRVSVVTDYLMSRRKWTGWSAPFGSIRWLKLKLETNHDFRSQRLLLGGTKLVSSAGIKQSSCDVTDYLSSNVEVGSLFAVRSTGPPPPRLRIWNTNDWNREKAKTGGYRQSAAEMRGGERPISTIQYAIR